MNNTAKAIGGTIAAVLVIGGTVIYQQLNKIADEPTGPGSGDEITVDEPTGPGSGDEIDKGNGPGEPGPGSGEEVIPGDPNYDPSLSDGKDRGNGPGEPGPGSGDEMPAEEPRGPGSDDFYEGLESDEPSGPGSGDEVPSGEPTGPGSGDEVPADEPTGPGSGDEVTADEPDGPGSGDEIPADEPTGPGSGEEANVVGSCNVIAFGSTCIDYIGSYWKTIEFAMANCSGEGTWTNDPCPQPSMGGCNTNAGQTTEMIIWHYNYGGDPFDAELAGYAATACAINPFGTWIGQ